ncbi:MAG: IS1595 family transposase [Peptostreptococcaceae bacterium]|nr:IS1595 family transposase [Peptostreptococcaceae bacterium]
MKYPANQMEFEEMFKTEQDCIDYLSLLRWPSGFECPQCGSIRFWKKNKGRYECCDCHKETKVTTNTMFHKTPKPILVWFRAIWWMIAQKNGVSAKGLQKILGLGSYQTAWTWLHKFRRLMVLSGRSKLHGMVEVDEAFVGGKISGKRGRGAEGKSLIAIAVEVIGRKTGRVRLEKIKDASSKSLKEFIEKNIEPSSTVITDGWPSYSELEQIGYNHKIQRAVVKEQDQEILPNVHRVVSLLKRWLLGTHQSYLNKNKLGYYLDEYVFRYNRRTSNSRGLLFMRLLEQAVIAEPVTYNEIIKENHGC